MLVNMLTRDRIVAITLGFSTQRPDHLRVAHMAAFTDVNITTFQCQWPQRLKAFDRLIHTLLEEQRHSYQTVRGSAAVTSRC